uniref:Uncharacterized protein n=1 Tax=Anopheles atroparvus TaxID=41427 RepID=A0AAG5DMA6_ANOAO
MIFLLNVHRFHLLGLIVAFVIVGLHHLFSGRRVLFYPGAFILLVVCSIFARFQERQDKLHVGVKIVGLASQVWLQVAVVPNRFQIPCHTTTQIAPTFFAGVNRFIHCARHGMPSLVLYCGLLVLDTVAIKQARVLFHFSDEVYVELLVLWSDLCWPHTLHVLRF